MQSGYHDDEEEWELERYGLDDRQASDSEKSEIEDALYRQIHYNICDDDDDEFRTSGIEKSLDSQSTENSSLQKDSLTNQSLGVTAPTRTDESTEAPSVKTAKLGDGSIPMATFSENDSDINGIEAIWDDEETHSKYNMGTNVKGQTKSVTNVESNDERAEDEIIIIADSADTSDAVEVKEVKTAPKEQSVESVSEPRNDTQRTTKSALSNEDGLKNRATVKINRDSLTSQPTKINRNEGNSRTPRSKASLSTGRAQSPILISDDENDSMPRKDSAFEVGKQNTARGAGTSKTTQSQGKSNHPNLGTVFYMDNKGMSLDAVKQDKTLAQSGWKEERKRTRAMLKETGRLAGMVVSSDEEDCMVIGSCSEEEGMSVHFDKSAVTKTSEKKWSFQPKKRSTGVQVGRYFVQSRQRNVKCHNCFEVGHTKAECPKPTRVPACILCGTRGHTDSSCPRALCFNCSLPGHRSKSCPMKKKLRYAVCTRCEMQGHDHQMCPDLWRQYHLTKDFGPLVKPRQLSKKKRPKKKALYCSNCSKRGHRYYDCRSSRFDEFTLFTYDQVCRYDGKTGAHVDKSRIPRHHTETQLLTDPRPQYDHNDDLVHQQSRKRKFGSDEEESQPKTSEKNETMEQKPKAEVLLLDVPDGETSKDSHPENDARLGASEILSQETTKCLPLTGKERKRARFKSWKQHEKDAKLGRNEILSPETTKCLPLTGKERRMARFESWKQREKDAKPGKNEILSPETTICFGLTNKQKKMKKAERWRQTNNRRVQQERQDTGKYANKNSSGGSLSGRDQEGVSSTDVQTQRQSERGFVLNRDLFQPTKSTQGNPIRIPPISSFNDDVPASHQSRGVIPQLHEMEQSVKAREMNVMVNVGNQGMDEQSRCVTRNAREDGSLVDENKKSERPYLLDFPRTSLADNKPNQKPYLLEFPRTSFADNKQNQRPYLLDFPRTNPQVAIPPPLRMNESERQRSASSSKRNNYPFYEEDFPRNSYLLDTPLSSGMVEPKSRRVNRVWDVRNKISGVLDRFVTGAFATRGTGQDEAQAAKKRKAKKRKAKQKVPRDIPETSAGPEILSPETTQCLPLPKKKRKKKKQSKEERQWYTEQWRAQKANSEKLAKRATLGQNVSGGDGTNETNLQQGGNYQQQTPSTNKRRKRKNKPRGKNKFKLSSAT